MYSFKLLFVLAISTSICSVGHTLRSLAACILERKIYDLLYRRYHINKIRSRIFFENFGGEQAKQLFAVRFIIQ